MQLETGSTSQPQDQLPAVIVQRADYGSALPGALAVPMSQCTDAARLPGTVEIAPTAANGFEEEWTALVFQLRSIDRTRFVRRMGVLDPADLDRILTELDDLTGR